MAFSFTKTLSLALALAMATAAAPLNTAFAESSGLHPRLQAGNPHDYRRYDSHRRGRGTYRDDYRRDRGAYRDDYRRDRGAYRGYRRGDGDLGPAIVGGIIGLTAGAILLSQQPRYVERAPAYRYAPEPWTTEWYRYCADKYRSFDPDSGTFQPYHGPRQLCR